MRFYEKDKIKVTILYYTMLVASVVIIGEASNYAVSAGVFSMIWITTNIGSGLKEKGVEDE